MPTVDATRPAPTCAILKSQRRKYCAEEEGRFPQLRCILPDFLLVLSSSPSSAASWRQRRPLRTAAVPQRIKPVATRCSAETYRRLVLPLKRPCDSTRRVPTPRTCSVRFCLSKGTSTRQQPIFE